MGLSPLVHHLPFSQGRNWVYLALLTKPVVVPLVTLGPEDTRAKHYLDRIADGKLKRVHFDASGSF